MTNPDKYIRIACITAINLQFTNAYATCPIYDTQVPKDVVPIPALRVILSTQTKKQANTTKCGHDWQCTLLFDIINEQPQGYSDRTIIEDIEELISNAIDLNPGDLDIPPFVVYNTQVADTHDMSLQTQVKSIDRKLVRYQWILGLAG